MSLERKDLRVYLDPEVHAAVLVLADLEGIEPAKLIERLSADWVRSRVRDASLIASRVDVQGLLGMIPAAPGKGRP